MRDDYLDIITTNINAYCDAHFDFAFNPNDPHVRLHEPAFGADEINALVRQALTTMVTMGSQVRHFEDDCRARFQAEHCLMSNSGSSANLLAVAALANPAWKDGLRPGDEVLVPALSWATTVWPLVQHQLVPVFVDCDLQTYNFNMQALEKAVTPKTRAIMLVHVYGNPCAMDQVMALARKHGLYVIEDCCEAMGASFDGKQVGSFGDAGTMSLYYSHHITTFEGGLTFTPHWELAELMRVLRAHGWSRETLAKDAYAAQYPDIDPRFIFINAGYNLRPTEVQAAMGTQQLPKLDRFIERRRAAHHAYVGRLEGYGDILQFQQEQVGGQASWFGFGVMVKDNAPFQMRELTEFLQARHIETRPIIAGNMAKHPALRLYPHRVSDSLSHCDAIMARGFAMGCHQAVDAMACDYVSGCVDEFMRGKGVKG